MHSYTYMTEFYHHKDTREERDHFVEISPKRIISRSSFDVELQLRNDRNQRYSMKRGKNESG